MKWGDYRHELYSLCVTTYTINDLCTIIKRKSIMHPYCCHIALAFDLSLVARLLFREVRSHWQVFAFTIFARNKVTTSVYLIIITCSGDHYLRTFWGKIGLYSNGDLRIRRNHLHMYDYAIFIYQYFKYMCVVMC